MKNKLLLISLIIIGISSTGCTNTKRKSFEYQEWHNVQTNEYGQKCTYTMPKKTEFDQNFSDGISVFVDGTLGVVLGVEKKCHTLAEWNGINRQANAMLGVVNSIQSIRSIQGGSSLEPNNPSYTQPSSDNGISSWSSSTPSKYWKPIPTTISTQPPAGYKSTYGNTYQYDLSKPMDRIKYKTDPNAQLRDRITPNPYKDIETNINQQGGGIYPADNSLKWIPVE